MAIENMNLTESLSIWRRHLYLHDSLAVSAAWHAGLIIASVAIGALDLFAGRDICLFMLFNIPIFLAAWKLGLWAGVSYAILCVLGTLAGYAYIGGMPLPGYELINALIRGAAFLLMVFGVWKIRVLGDAVTDLSLIDSITGLHNRRSFFLHGSFELSKSARFGQPLSVLYCDIDNFKSVNDTHGHAEGDALLNRIGQSFKEGLRQTDTPARLGGDEFAAILPTTAGPGATRLAMKLRDKLNAVFVSLPGVQVSASMGIATFHFAPASFDEIVKAADDIMYEVKSRGKNDILQRDYGGKV